MNFYFYSLLVVSIISLTVYKKINPDCFWLYLGYVMVILIIGLLYFKPWPIFA